MYLLTRLEEAILIAVFSLGEEAYGVPINREVSRVCKRPYTMGGLYFALDQLVRKRFLKKRSAGTFREKGLRNRTYYELTPEGCQALEAVRRYQIKLWRGVPQFHTDEGS